MQTQNADTHQIGIVFKKMLGFYNVHYHDQVIRCAVSSKLWKDFETTKLPGISLRRVKDIREKHMDPVAIGDHVAFIPIPDGSGMIVDVLPRQNFLARRSAKPMPGAHAFEQVIAANLEKVVPVFAAANPKPKWHLLDRYLVTAELYGIPATVVVTKFDLVQGKFEEQELMTVVERYRAIGYPVVLTSAKKGDGLETLQHKLANYRSVLVGKSGVGKTSLLNALEPGLGLRVKANSQKTGKGRHTTSHMEMFSLSQGGAIIDTPGVREFGIWDLSPEDIAYYFPEMATLLGHCKFGLSCQHDEEPGCAIRQAVMEGSISPYRYKSYLRLKADL